MVVHIEKPAVVLEQMILAQGEVVFPHWDDQAVLGQAEASAAALALACWETVKQLALVLAS